MSLLLVEKRGPIAIASWNRPDSLNALGQDGDGLEVVRVCADLNHDPDLRCVVLTGAGKAFSAGGDVKAMQNHTGMFAGPGVMIKDNYRRNVHQLVRALYGLDLPLITAINGPAIGLGGDIATLGDIRIASTKARFGVTFLKLGIIPGDGGAWLLPRIVGHARAAELLFTGQVIDAETMKEWGVVSRVVEPEALMDAALALAEAVAAQPPHALRMAKNLLRQGQTASFDQIMELSAAYQALAHHTEDHAEGVAALLEKRDPDFKGR